MWLIRRWREAAQRDKDYGDRIANIYKEIESLPLDEARARLERALSDSRVFICVEGDSDEDRLLLLSPGTRDLLSRFSSIKTTEGIEVARNFIEVAEAEPSFVQIGIDMDADPVYLSPPSEPIYINFTEGLEPEPTFSSVYHWLLNRYLTSLDLDGE